MSTSFFQSGASSGHTAPLTLITIFSENDEPWRHLSDDQKEEHAKKIKDLLKIVTKKTILLNLDITNLETPFSRRRKKEKDQIEQDSTPEEQKNEFIIDYFSLDGTLELIEHEENLIVVIFARKRSLWEKFRTGKGVEVPLALIFLQRMAKQEKLILPIDVERRYLILRRRKFSTLLQHLIKESEESLYISDYCLHDLVGEILEGATLTFIHEYLKLRELMCAYKIPSIEEERENVEQKTPKSPLIRYLQVFTPGEFVALKGLLEDTPKELRRAVQEFTDLMNSIDTIKDICETLLYLADRFKGMLYPEIEIEAPPKDLKNFSTTWNNMDDTNLLYESLKHVEWILYTSVGAFHLFMLIHICLTSNDIARTLQYASNFIQTTASLVFASELVINVLDKKDCFKWEEILTEWKWKLNNAKCRFEGGLMGALSALSKCKYASKELRSLTKLMKPWNENITKYRNISPLAHGFVLETEAEKLRNVINQFENLFNIWESSLRRVVEKLFNFSKKCDLGPLNDEQHERIIQEIDLIYEELLNMLLALDRPKIIKALTYFTSESALQLYWVCLLQDECDLTEI